MAGSGIVGSNKNRLCVPELTEADNYYIIVNVSLPEATAVSRLARSCSYEVYIADRRSWLKHVCAVGRWAGPRWELASWNSTFSPEEPGNALKPARGGRGEPVAKRNRSDRSCNRQEQHSVIHTRQRSVTILAHGSSHDSYHHHHVTSLKVLRTCSLNDLTACQNQVTVLPSAGSCEYFVCACQSSTLMSLRPHIIARSSLGDRMDSSVCKVYAHREGSNCYHRTTGTYIDTKTDGTRLAFSIQGRTETLR